MSSIGRIQVNLREGAVDAILRTSSREQKSPQYVIADILGAYIKDRRRRDGDASGPRRRCAFEAPSN